MVLRLPDRWVWDFWTVTTEGRVHAFYLQAPRSLGDPDLRHVNATVGHAVSADLRTWEVLPDALGPGAPGSWDDVATWTGSVVRHEGRWWMFYTGASSTEDALVQRVGAAVSEDLVTWSKHPANPLLETDASRYETLDLTAWHDEAWRDPWVLPGDDGDHHMLLTARVRAGHGPGATAPAPTGAPVPADGRGVVAHARSTDLVHWETLDPVTEPGAFGHLEVPQVVEHDGAWYLLFSCGTAQASATRRASGRPTPDGSYVARGPGPLGPFDVAAAVPLAAPGLYSCRVVHDPDGVPYVLGFVTEDGDGQFAGVLSDPLPLAAALRP